MVWGAQRVGVLQNLTLQEFAKASREDEEWILHVGSHKTSNTYGMAKLVFEEDDWKLMQRLGEVRLKMASPEDDEYPNSFFVLSTGGTYKHFFQDVNSSTGLQVRGVTLPCIVPRRLPQRPLANALEVERGRGRARGNLIAYDWLFGLE